MFALVRIFLILFIGGSLIQAQVNILTANGNNDRTNANLQEPQLTPELINQDTFGKLSTFVVDGQVYAQPLYVSGLKLADKTRNVLFVTTMHNTVYAFDADSPVSSGLLWSVNLGQSVPAAALFRYPDIGIEVGILATGTIDLQHGVLYVVAETLGGGGPAFYLHALELISGREKMQGPVAIAGSAPGGLAFDPSQHIQRPGLLLTNNTVYVAFGSHSDQKPYHGWIFTYNASNLLLPAGVFTTTPSDMGGAIWQSGRGLGADGDGNVYAMSGNGDYDGAQNFGESFLRLSGTPLVLADSFTPANWQAMSDNDFDLSTGPALIPGTHTILGADKLGNFYVLNGDSMHQAVSGNAVAASNNSIFNFAVWNRPGGAYVYVQGEQEPAQCFQLTGSGLNPAPISATSNALKFGRIGMTLSARGAQDNTGILWETTGDYNTDPTAGTLHAFDATDLSVELWNSDMNPGRDRMGPIAKFANPTVANGKVYVPTLGNAVVVYGLIGGGDVLTPSIDAITNSASYASDAVSPGELVAIFGSNLGPDPPLGMELDESGRVATNLGATQVLFDGVPGPMAFSSANQVNALVPFGLTADATEIQVEYQGQLSNTFSIAVAPSHPGIFAADSSGNGQGLIFNQDGTSNSASNPAVPGSVVVFYATGAGLLTPLGQDGTVVTGDSPPLPLLPVAATVGGQPAKVLYAGGAAGIVQGIIQVNLQIPDNVPGPTAPVMLQIGAAVSQTGLTLTLAAR